MTGRARWAISYDEILAQFGREAQKVPTKRIFASPGRFICRKVALGELAGLGGAPAAWDFSEQQ
jgi:hypothetical protein